MPGQTTRRSFPDVKVSDSALGAAVRAEGARETAFATARNLKTLGVSVQIIAKATGLTEDEIAKL